MLRLFILVILLIAQPVSAQTQQAAVAMPDSYSADVARQVLEDGGNAVDAAVAANFVLAVTLPEAGNIGGGGFMLIYKDNQADFLDYREKAPLAAHKDMYLDDKGNVIQEKPLYGILASGVPGAVMGMWQAHQKYGTKVSPDKTGYLAGRRRLYAAPQAGELSQTLYPTRQAEPP